MGDFWVTMNVLVGKEFKKIKEDVDEWVNNVVKKDNNYEDGNKLSVAKFDRVPSFCSSLTTNEVYEEDIQRFWKKLNLPKVECILTNKEIKTKRIVELMGSSYVNLVDRDFMQKLQQKLQEDHTNKMVERIKTRECEEMDRVKNLVLDGKIPLKLAPPEMECHPIMFLESYINSGQKRRQKASKLSNPSTARSFQLKTPSSRITQENENDNENNEKKLEFGFTRSSTLSNEEMPKETTNEFVKVKHDTELMKQLRNAETVDEMYNLAEEIIGYLRQEDSTIKSSDDTISSSN